MRKILLAITVFSCFLTGCKRYQCEPLFNQNEIPLLKPNDYNSCEAICKNYHYRLCDGNQNEYPYWSHQGDTIMICGYMHEYWDGNRGHFLLFDSPNNANEYLFCININTYGSLVQLPEDVDISKKCYIKGRLYFTPLHTNGGPVDIMPVIGDIQEMYFE